MEYTPRIKYIERETLRGILIFLSESEYIPGWRNLDENRGPAIYYLAFYSKIENDLQECPDVTAVIKNHIAEFKQDYHNVIQSLYVKTYDRIHVTTIVSLVEHFISETILIRQEKLIH